MPEFLPEIPDEYRDAHESAVALSQDPNLHRAFGALVGDEKLAGAAARDCRTYRRINRKTGKLEEAEVCFGIEIVPNPVPGGPWG
jgi:hypothetical protein